MRFPVDRRTAFSGMAGAALGYRPPAAGRGAESGAVQDVVAAMPDDPGGIRAKLGERPSVRDKGAKGDGTSMDGAAIQDALRSFDTVWVPPGVYMVDVPLTLPSYCVLAFSSNAVFCPVHDNMTVFRTAEVSYASRLLAPRIHARGKRGVTAFDLQGFRHRAEIQHADVMGCARGIVLRALCWDTLIHMPWIRDTANPIVIANGSNAVDVIHPGIDGCDVGITIRDGPDHATTSARIWGGYVQNGRCGIVDDGCFGTVVDGTYFEGLRDGDIVLSRAIRSNLSRTQHYGDKGRTAIRMAEVDGATVFDPVMSSGARTVGLYDIDDLSRNVTRFESNTATGLNQPLGKIANSATMVREEGGTFRPVLAGQAAVTYGLQEGRWRRSGGQMTIAIELGWSRALPGSALVLAGLPTLPTPSIKPLAAVAPAVVQGTGNAATHARLGQDGIVRVVAMENGREKPVTIGPSGSVTVSIVCLV